MAFSTLKKGPAADPSCPHQPSRARGRRSPFSHRRAVGVGGPSRSFNTLEKGASRPPELRSPALARARQTEPVFHMAGGSVERGAFEHVAGTSQVRNFDIAPDGTGLVMVEADPDESATHLQLVLNWHEEVADLVPSPGQCELSSQHHRRARDTKLDDGLN